MAQTLKHRGPDDFGVWADDEASVALGHCRLSILDLSAEGHQPMVSVSGRYITVFNGEIYNFRQIRRKLENSGKAPVFRGESDTEVLLAAIEAWGVENAVREFVGMFAFALWDHQERSLRLVRDRLGKKPLYYGWHRGTLLFGSELKALKAYPDSSFDVDPVALSLYLRHNYVPGPYSIYSGIYKLLPGSILTASPCFRPPWPRYLLSLDSYWSVRDVWVRGAAEPWSETEEECVDILEGMLREAIRIRMISDVPLGAFLSGGIDSSTVVSLMQSLSSRPIKTYSIGFDDRKFNEADYALQVARHLGTDHTEFYVRSADAIGVIPELPRIYDEPFADSSQIPTFLIARLARQEVTVCLTGDGGDELFDGYGRYREIDGIARRVSLVPLRFRPLAGQLLRRLHDQILALMVDPIDFVMNSKTTPARALRLIDRYADLLQTPSFGDLYRCAVSYVRRPEMALLLPEPAGTEFSRTEELAKLLDRYQLQSYLDTFYYLPDDILVKVDRATMAVGLEARAPLLDQRVVELSARIPTHLKVRNGKQKYLLRKVLERYVPERLIDRPKMGFGVPIGEWLRGPLGNWANHLLDAKRITAEGYFNVEYVRNLWKGHQSGKRDFSYNLWGVLMFQQWLSQK